MRTLLSAFQLSLLFSLGCTHPPNLAPFIFAIDGQEERLYTNNDTSIPPQSDSSEQADSPLHLFKRQNCSPDFYYCSTIPSTAVCCPTTALCTTDAANNAACCPLGSFCTGTIPVGVVSIAPSPALSTSNPVFITSSPVTAVIITTTSSSAAAGGAAGGLVTLTITSTTLIPITTISTTAFGTAASTAPTITGPANTIPPSYVPNAYSFPFAYLPSTSFSNSAACASAYSSCAAEYAVCTSDLQGGATGFGVTIVGPSTTVVGGGAGGAAGTSLPAQQAIAVCESLSNIACPGVAGGCAVFGTDGGTPTATGAVGTAATVTVVESRTERRVVGGKWGVVAGILLMAVVGWIL